jgi:hypothetical protein
MRVRTSGYRPCREIETVSERSGRRGSVSETVWEACCGPSVTYCETRTYSRTRLPACLNFENSAHIRTERQP